DQDGVMRNLNDLIPQGSGWVLGEATAVNDAGVIVGWGHHGADLHAFRLEPGPTIAVDGTSYFTSGNHVVTVLFVEGSYMTPGGTVEIDVNGHPAGSVIADSNGEVSWGTDDNIKCGNFVSVRAIDLATGFDSNTATIKIDCP